MSEHVTPLQTLKSVRDLYSALVVAYFNKKIPLKKIEVANALIRSCYDKCITAINEENAKYLKTMQEKFIAKNT